MNWEVFVTCAVTGAGDTVSRSELVPVTPEQIADSAIEAARAGAAIVHLHVRDPETGKGGREPRALPRGRRADPRLRRRPRAEPDRRDGRRPRARRRRGAAAARRRPAPTWRARPSGSPTSPSCGPEICTLDCGTMNFAAGGDYVMTNTPAMLRAMAEQVRALGVKPELEVFDTGHLVFVHELIRDGLIDDPPLIQLCMGIPYGAPDDPTTLLAMVQRLPANAVFSAFSIGRMQLPYAALAPIVGGNVRVGLEDNLFLSRGQLATNAELVERAVAILEALNVRVLGPDEVRERLALRAVADAHRSACSAAA